MVRSRFFCRVNHPADVVSWLAWTKYGRAEVARYSNGLVVFFLHHDRGSWKKELGWRPLDWDPSWEEIGIEPW